MQKHGKAIDPLSANQSDYSEALCTVSICFADPMINHLFSELLEARGVRTRIVSDITEAVKETKIITEPQFFPDLEPSQRTSCLIVGNKESLKDVEALSLSRPLTEEKIESALSDFLKRA